MGKIAKAARKIVAMDREATHRAAKHRDGPVVRLLGVASEAADQPPLLLLGAGTILVGAVLRRPVTVRAGIRMFTSEVLATVIKRRIKRAVDRTRPDTALETGKHRFEPGQSDDHAQTSFPSGHTAGAVAVARAVAHEVPGTALPAYAAATAVGAVQMPRGKHYLFDTLAGAAIGYVAEAGAGVLMRAGERVVLPAVRRVAARLAGARR